MRTVTFGEVFDNAARYAGRDPDQLDTTEAARLVSFINARVRHGWNYADWPELRVCQERRFRDAWQSTLTYAIDEEVWHETTGKYWTALQVSLNQEPVAGSAYWEETSTLQRYIPYIMRDRYPIGTVYLVSKQNPYQYADRLYTYPFTLANEGVWVHDCNLNSVWMVMRPRESKYTRTAHSVTGSYSSGDLVYMAEDQQVKQAVLVAGVQVWIQVDFPAFLSEYVSWAAAGDWMLWNGERDRADRAWATADTMLVDAESREMSQPGQGGRVVVRGM